jgi:hypothetical protein
MWSVIKHCFQLLFLAGDSKPRWIYIRKVTGYLYSGFSWFYLVSPRKRLFRVLILTVCFQLINFGLFLKCLLASRLTLLRLPSFTSLGTCNHCSVACFQWSTTFNSSWDYCLWCFGSQWPLVSLAEILMFSLIVSQAQLTFPLFRKFSKAANMF